MGEELEKLHHEKQELVRASSAEPPKETEGKNEEQMETKNILEKVAFYKRILLEASDCDMVSLHEVFLLPDQEDFHAKCRLLEDKLEKLSVERKLDEFISNTN